MESDVPLCSIDGDVGITDAKTIADKFNKCLTEIGHKLSGSIDTANKFLSIHILESYARAL